MQTVSDLRTSLDLFLDDLVSSNAADYRRLLTDDTLFLNGRLAKFYNAKLPPDADFQAVKFEPADPSRHPFASVSLGVAGVHRQQLPIHRGVFISRSILGRALRPPPEAVRTVGPRSARFADDARARSLADRRSGLPVVPLDDQLARLQPGKLRRGRPFSRKGRGSRSFRKEPTSRVTATP